MKRIVQYWQEYFHPKSLKTQLEQQEFVLRLILGTALMVLAPITIIMWVGTSLGYPMSLRVVDIISAVITIILGMFLASRGYIKFVRYLLVVSMFAVGMWHTVVDGLGGINFYYFVIALLFAFMILNRRLIVVIAIIVIPLSVDLILHWGANYDYGKLLKYLGFSVGFSILLVSYNQILNIFRTERKLVTEVENVQRAGASIMSSLDIQETISRILDQLTTIIPHDSACVLLLEDDSYLEIVGGRGWNNPDDVIGIRFPVPGENPNTVVIETGKPYILGNAPEVYPDFLKEPHNHIMSWLGIPLIRDGNTIGMMAIDSKEPNHFSEEHIRVLSSFADYVSIAIENALLYEVAHQSVRRRAILHQASQDVIKASADAEEIYNAIYKAAKQLMPCEAFAITLQRGEVYEGVFLIDHGQRRESMISPIGTGLSGKVIGTGESVLIEDLEDQVSLEGTHFGDQDYVQSLVAVPLKTGDEVIGMLTAQSYSPSVYEEEDLKLLEMLGANAAISIKNAELLAKVAHLARTDSLTGLLNRRAFDQELVSTIASANRYNFSVSLLMIDIDDFKHYNDLYGHLKGDDHLIKIAKLIKKCVRQLDVVARVGGEEFAVVLPHTSLKGGINLAERIREQVYKKFKAKNVPGGTVSIGVTTFPGGSVSSKDLYNVADKAMFSAKNKGKNRVISISLEGETV